MTISDHQTAAETFCVRCCDSRRLCYQAQWSEMKNGGDSEGKAEKRNREEEQTGGSNCGRKLKRVEIKEKRMN